MNKKLVILGITMGLCVGMFAAPSTASPIQFDTTWCTSDAPVPCVVNGFQLVGWGCSTVNGYYEIIGNKTGPIPCTYCCAYSTYECIATGQIFNIRDTDSHGTRCLPSSTPPHHQCPNIGFPSM